MPADGEVGNATELRRLVDTEVNVSIVAHTVVETNGTTNAVVVLKQKHKQMTMYINEALSSAHINLLLEDAHYPHIDELHLELVNELPSQEPQLIEDNEYGGGIAMGAAAVVALLVLGGGCAFFLLSGGQGEENDEEQGEAGHKDEERGATGAQTGLKLDLHQLNPAALTKDPALLASVEDTLRDHVGQFAGVPSEAVAVAVGHAGADVRINEMKGMNVDIEGAKRKIENNMPDFMSGLVAKATAIPGVSGLLSGFNVNDLAGSLPVPHMDDVKPRGSKGSELAAWAAEAAGPVGEGAWEAGDGQDIHLAFPEDGTTAPAGADEGNDSDSEVWDAGDGNAAEFQGVVDY